MITQYKFTNYSSTEYKQTIRELLSDYFDSIEFVSKDSARDCFTIIATCEDGLSLHINDMYVTSETNKNVHKYYNTNANGQIQQGPMFTTTSDWCIITHIVKSSKGLFVKICRKTDTENGKDTASYDLGITKTENGHTMIIPISSMVVIYPLTYDSNDTYRYVNPSSLTAQVKYLLSPIMSIGDDIHYTTGIRWISGTEEASVDNSFSRYSDGEKEYFRCSVFMLLD